MQIECACALNFLSVKFIEFVGWFKYSIDYQPCSNSVAVVVCFH